MPPPVMEQPEAIVDSVMLSRLYRSVKWSKEKLKPFCQQRIERLKYFVGSHYGDNGSDQDQPLAIIELLISVYARQLASATPQVLVSTKYDQLKASAADLELAVNHLIRDEINLADTLRRIAVDALIGVGICKVGLAVSDTSESEHGYDRDPGQPFAESILLENLVVDMSARSWQDVHYIGDVYQVPLEDVLANEEFNAETRGKLQARTSDATERSKDLSSEQLQVGENESMGRDDEFVPLVSLMDLWLPRYNLLLTLPCDNLGDGVQPLRVVEWDGPEHGPYHVLGFEDVPGNLLPLPPAALIEDLHHLSNTLFNKLGRQANRQKTVLFTAPGQGGDAERIRTSDDGDIIPVVDPKNIQEVSTGGINQENFGFVLQLRQFASLFGGNLDALGGLSAQSDTVGQDKLLVGNASQRVKDMQDRMVLFTKKLITDLAFYLWHDPLINMPMVKRVEGTDIEIPVTYAPERREGDFFQYNLSIDPYSLVAKTPDERANQMMTFIGQALPVLMPLMQAAGQSLDTEKLFKKLAKYGFEDLNDLIVYTEGQTDSSDATPVTPPNTTRTYERISRSTGGTRASQDSVIAQAAFGGNPQAKERTAAVRLPGM